MLETVDVGTQDLNLYERSAGAEAVAQLRQLAAPLEGVRILHVNATPYGGGVAEILRSEIPLLRDLGLLADWKLITGDQTFFSVTKAIHNGLQGAPRELAPAEQETYLTHSVRNAQLLDDEYDLVVVHDPQPLALLRLHGKGAARWVWRCHIDTSEPNLQVWNFLRPYLEGYDATVFTLGSFAPPDIPVERVEIIPPAIDPESPKNFELDARVASRLLRWIGVEVEQPLVTQVSRFDPWKDDHNGFSHQGPGLIDVMLSKRGTVARIYLPPDANTLLSVTDHYLRSRNYVNLIAIDKQPQLQWLDMDAAIEHAARGASVWEWASNVPEGEEPDVVLACAGDIPTLETIAAAHWLREHAPELKVRVVNVVDLMTLFPREFHPHGMSETRFVDLFTANKQVVFAFHGYRRAIHEIVHGHVDVDRFHVRGFSEQGTTTTPFDMVVLNGMSRYHLAMDVLTCIGPECRAHDRAPTLVSELEASISRATAYFREHLQDPPEIREWVWTS